MSRTAGLVEFVLEPELQGAGVHYSVVARNREPGHFGYRTGDNITRLTIQHRTSQRSRTAHLHSPIPRALDSGHAPAPRSAFAGSGRDGATPTPSFELVEVSRIRVPPPPPCGSRLPRLATWARRASPRPGDDGPDERTSDYWGRRAGPARARAPRGLGDGPRNYLRYYRCILNESRPSY